jgi:hypothetical protein
LEALALLWNSAHTPLVVTGVTPGAPRGADDSRRSDEMAIDPIIRNWQGEPVLIGNQPVHRVGGRIVQIGNKPLHSLGSGLVVNVGSDAVQYHPGCQTSDDVEGLPVIQDLSGRPSAVVGTSVRPSPPPPPAAPKKPQASADAQAVNITDVFARLPKREDWMSAEDYTQTLLAWARRR